MKLMLTPTSGVPSEVTTCPRMTQAWLRRQGGREKKKRVAQLHEVHLALFQNANNEKRKISNRKFVLVQKGEKQKRESKFDLKSLHCCFFFPLPSGLSASLRYANEA